MIRTVAGILAFFLGGLAMQATQAPASQGKGDAAVRLGNFSVSLAVKDMAASRAFYEKLGFRKLAGDPAKNWLILQNETATIGLFHGPQFTKNVLTFNPGWDRNCATLKEFDDVREIQKKLQAEGLEFTMQAEDASTGPASFMLTDPDGNPVLVDQHVPKPGK